MFKRGVVIWEVYVVLHHSTSKRGSTAFVSTLFFHFWAMTLSYSLLDNAGFLELELRIHRFGGLGARKIRNITNPVD